MQPGVTNPLNEPPVTSSQKWPARRHRERKRVHRRLLACNARRKSIAPAQLARIHFIDSSACNGICVFPSCDPMLFKTRPCMHTSEWNK